MQGGTGTGKSLAYLVPVLLSERTVVIATATKALQDQLADKDLPFLAEHLDRPVRVRRAQGPVQLPLPPAVERGHQERRPARRSTASTRQPAVDELAAIVDWAKTHRDRRPGRARRRAVGPGVEQRQRRRARVPRRLNCPQGESCFTEQARTTAAEADVIVVNTHLYGLHLATGGGLLPEHDVVVIDEAHQLEETISATVGLELTGGRFGDAGPADRRHHRRRRPRRRPRGRR